MTTTPVPEVPVLSPLELTARWSDLLHSRCSMRSLWLAWMTTEGLMLPLLTPVDDLPVSPDPSLCDALLAVHCAVVDDVGVGRLHLTTALSRPGPPEVTAGDVAWCEVLRTGLGERIDGSWSLHLAASGTVIPLINPPVWAWG